MRNSAGPQQGLAAAAGANQTHGRHGRLRLQVRTPGGSQSPFYDDLAKVCT